MKKSKNKPIDEDRTFFCSELVAKCLKECGVIVNDETPCTSFYPHHFCQKGDSSLKLTSGTKINE